MYSRISNQNIPGYEVMVLSGRWRFPGVGDADIQG